MKIQLILTCLFFSNEKYLNHLSKIKAKACLIENKYVNYLPKNCKPIVVDDPYLALAIISRLFYDNIYVSNGKIAKNIIVSPSCKISKNVQINSFCILNEKTDLMRESLIYGTEYIQTKYQCFENLRKSSFAKKTCVVFPTLVFVLACTLPS